MRMHVSYILFAACTAAFTVATARPAVAQFTITYVDATVANTVQANSNDDGNVYWDEIDLYVKQRVKELTNGQQHPVSAHPSLRDFPLTKLH